MTHTGLFKGSVCNSKCINQRSSDCCHWYTERERERERERETEQSITTYHEGKSIVQYIPSIVAHHCHPDDHNHSKPFILLVHLDTPSEPAPDEEGWVCVCVCVWGQTQVRDTFYPSGLCMSWWEERGWTEEWMKRNGNKFPGPLLSAFDSISDYRIIQFF